MDFKSILKLLSLIGMTLSLFFTMNIAVALIYNENYLPVLLFVTLFFSVNFIIWLFLKNYPLNLGIRESILAVNSLWALLGVAGAAPLLLYTPISPSSAFFEAISGFTTTGATVFSDIESLPKTVSVS